MLRFVIDQLQAGIMKVAIIGAGNVGRTLGVSSGHDGRFSAALFCVRPNFLALDRRCSLACAPARNQTLTLTLNLNLGRSLKP